ncbi:BRO-N domain-containing protein [Mitsuokella jalaludinii]|uniref:BRO-N domain-containing protein n=1 Tax=Mitsuokella jalaludinii TaxID=187979 RepID=UPI003078C5BA
MNELQIFSSPEFGELRTIEEGDKMYFGASDGATMLADAKPNNAVSAHGKGTLKRGIPTGGGVQQMNVIPEGDLYRLIVNSELPSAEKFESWVFDEVLPAIRKTGGYSMKKKAQAEQDKTREMRAEAMLRNSISKQAKMMMEIAKMSHIKAYQDVMMAKAGNILAGENILPMPKSGRERRPLGWFCKQIGKAETWGTQLGKLLKRNGITQRPGENGEFVEDCARNNPHKHVQNFEWYVDYLLPIVQRDFMN